jgi:hypothetical protein
VLKSTIETAAPVPESAVRKALAAPRTVSANGLTEPDSSSTSMTLMPQRGGRFGLEPGSVTRMASARVSVLLSLPEQLLFASAVKSVS